MEEINFSKIDKTKMEISTRVVKPMVIYLDKKFSRTVIDQFINETGLDRKYLSDENKWVSFDYYNLFLEKLVQFTGNPRATFEAGIYVLSKEAYGSLYSLLIVLKLFGSPKIVYKKLCEFSSTYTNVGKVVWVSSKKNRTILKSTFMENYKQTKLNCLAIQGQLTYIPLFWNLPLAKVKELECAAEGHKACVYEITWLPRSLKKSILTFIALLLFAVELVLFFFNSLPWLDIKVLLISGLIAVILILTEQIYNYRVLLAEDEIIHEERSKALADALQNSKKEYLQVKEANIRIFEVVNKLTILNYIAEEIFQIDKEEDLIKKILNIIAGCMNFDRGCCLFFNEHYEMTKPAMVLDIAKSRDISFIPEKYFHTQQWELASNSFEKIIPRLVNIALFGPGSTDTICMPLTLRDNYYLFLFDNYQSKRSIKTSRLFFFSTIANQVRLALENIFTSRAAHNIISSIPSAILIFDQDTKEISFVNKAYLNNYRIDINQVLGKSIMTLLNISSFNRDIFLEKIADVSDSNYVDYQELPLDNKIIGYTLFKMPMNARGKSEIGMVMRDITRQKELQDQLLRSEKLVALGTLASGVAHEINNPLYGVLGTAEVIVDETESAEIKKMAEDIIDFTMQVSDIVKDLSSYSRSIREEKPRELNINTIIDETLRILKYSPIFIDIKVEKEFGDIPDLFALGGEISQIFMNLINNALQAMEGKGKLKIITENSHKSIRATIEDDGPGIPPEIITKIFDPFFTTKPAGAGTGLGLHIVYRLVTKYNGFIKAMNAEKHGAKFIVDFPLQEHV